MAIISATTGGVTPDKFGAMVVGQGSGTGLPIYASFGGRVFPQTEAYKGTPPNPDGYNVKMSFL
jgi:hypothetical protein